MFQVKWVQTVEDELMTLWMDNKDSSVRAAINAASGLIDSVLKSDPLHVGESHDDDFRITLVDPLTVVFQVDTAASIVWGVHLEL
jgi:hypothetical protein